jgi:hypothetical protein
MKRNVIVLILPLLICCTNQTKALESVLDVPRKFPLSVWSICPSWGVMGEETYLSIQGVGFEEGAEVYIGDKQCRDAWVKNNTTIICEQPEQAKPGYYPVTVKNPDGEIQPVPAPKNEDLEEDEEDSEGGQLFYFYREL